MTNQSINNAAGNFLYLFKVIEAMADGAVMMGLPRDLAVEHAAATVRGAATMVATVSIIGT